MIRCNAHPGKTTRPPPHLSLFLSVYMPVDMQFDMKMWTGVRGLGRRVSTQNN